MKTIKLHLITVAGAESDHEISRRDSFRRIYELLGCQGCDCVNLRDGRVMIVDDTGLIDGKPINLKATALYHSIYDTPNPIAGDVAIALDEDFA